MAWAGLDGDTTTEAGDLFGYALAAGATSGGKPYLAIGVPGEAIGDRSDAGCIHYVQGSTRTTVNQDDPDVPGVAEPNDRSGHSLAATSRYVAVGAPGEAIGDESFAGALTLFDHALEGGRPTALESRRVTRRLVISAIAPIHRRPEIQRRSGITRN
ncbi:hypothetical protein ACFVYR_29585 [Streptomyces sp. NPDC058284]|uniref:hypothetical protein n=1 Tax=unclassified Streptomyces TaxID=2593676 RepID=UPI0036547332